MLTDYKNQYGLEDINGELEECYEMMYKEPVQESDIRGLVLCLLYTSRCV